jgi:hypothetical protein
LAPMFGWVMLSAHDYRAVYAQNIAEKVSVLQYSLFNYLCMVPAACAVIQLALWAQYSLHGHYAQTVKASHSKHTV